MRNTAKYVVNIVCILSLSTFVTSCASRTKTGSISHGSSSYAAPVKRITVCSGYGCIIQDKFGFTARENRRLKNIMSRGKSSASAERKAVGFAISAMEKMARGHLRYAPDIAFSYQKNASKRGQMDCVDESLNTMSYLNYLQRKGWLRHHETLSSYAERGLIIDGRYPHKSARMRDKAGVDWAVDSWKGRDGAKPEVMALAKWYQERNSSNNY